MCGHSSVVELLVANEWQKLLPKELFKKIKIIMMK
tara:strand:- start:38 stop:142 length:105 start_codon:yes stop_codon:yes gene_type:complete